MIELQTEGQFIFPFSAEFQNIAAISLAHEQTTALRTYQRPYERPKS